MMRFYKAMAEQFLIALYITKSFMHREGLHTNAEAGNNIQDTYRRFFSGRVDRQFSTENSGIPTTPDELIRELEQRLYSDGGKETDGGIIDTIVDILHLPFVENGISSKQLRQLRKALFSPEELMILREELKKQELMCGCGHVFESGELGTLRTNEEGGVRLHCASCLRPTRIACRCGKKAQNLSDRGSKLIWKETACSHGEIREETDVSEPETVRVEDPAPEVPANEPIEVAMNRARDWARELANRRAGQAEAVGGGGRGGGQRWRQDGHPVVHPANIRPANIHIDGPRVPLGDIPRDPFPQGFRVPGNPFLVNVNGAPARNAHIDGIEDMGQQIIEHEVPRFARQEEPLLERDRGVLGRMLADAPPPAVGPQVMRPAEAMIFAAADRAVRNILGEEPIAQPNPQPNLGEAIRRVARVAGEERANWQRQRDAVVNDGVFLDNPWFIPEDDPIANDEADFDPIDDGEGVF